MFLMDSYIGFCSFGAPYRYQYSGLGMSWCNLDGDNDHLVFVGEADSVNTVFAVGGYDDGDSSVTLTDSDTLSLRADYEDSDCVLYLDFEDVDEAGTIYDRSSSGHTVTPSGDFEIDRGQKKFGTSSGMFTSVAGTITIADSDDFYFADSDFTIELWMRLPGDPVFAGILYRQMSDPSNLINFYHTNTPDNLIVFDLKIGGSSVVLLQSEAISWTLDQWYHLAVTRSGNDWKIFRDGVILDSATAAVTVPNFSGSVYQSFAGYLSGWLDEYRILKGRAEYTDTFTPPTVAHGASYTKEYEIQTIALADYGRESDMSDTRSFEIDSNGVLVQPAGNAPANLQAKLLTGGKVQLSWTYDQTDQPATPTGFKIYTDTVYSDSVAYVSGRRRYTWTSDSLTHGVEKTFRVRTYRTVSEVDYYDSSTTTVTATPDAQGPAAITGITIA